MFRRFPPPRHSVPALAPAWRGTGCTRCTAVVSSLASPSHREPRRAAATSPPIDVWPSVPTAVARGEGGTPVCIPAMILGRRACIGTHHTQRPHRCVRGALNGAIASACAAVHRAPNHDRAPPPFPRPSNLITPGQSPSCYSSRKLSVRARGSHRCPLRFGVSRSRFQSYANPDIRRAEVRLSMHCSQSAARR